MKAHQRVCAAAIAVAFSAHSANAVCIYHGKMSAKTTLAQEFADSQWVVRVKVLSAENHWSLEDDSWTIYHLQVVTAFKGNPGARIDMFTHRDSGGFYLDKGMANDLGGEYLLFLDPVSHRESAPDAARDATEVNYSCGQSGAWKALSLRERRKLLTLSQK
jgi:hypothetical protein